MLKQTNLFPATAQDFVLFDGNTNIRKERHNEERYFSVVDIVGVLTLSSQPSRYWRELKDQLMKYE
jgi:hypothetical protein